MFLTHMLMFCLLLCSLVLILVSLICFYFLKNFCSIKLTLRYQNIFHISSSSFGGLGVVYWPLVPKFVGSNPAEAFGFLRVKKSSARLPSEGK